MDRRWRSPSSMHWSVISDLFEGVLKSTLECLTCRKGKGGWDDIDHTRSVHAPDSLHPNNAKKADALRCYGAAISGFLRGE
ncbi:hypothetical protein BDK51DRAFT_37742 [Blyttiomyces helicus]|uniref:Uncharacterized protein n=1 Tax=Blyttiomyces helicus TaxID=388810 RepID=A0A4P9VXB2_9FUNG|nr:hypothetical protein BDK51DRAFT_37742 [Blyttiomyces helicus]|eukprot:RKO83535.1 hypothetical protein BDK51DRAFT_37742 [Blyttiomyces helicus]